MRFSACMIVKDEAPILAASLAALTGRVDEIVVVDGGSQDETVGIAERAGARVFVQEGGFSDNRNRALREASGQVCLMIDADEVVEASSWPAFLAFFEQGLHPRGRIQVVSDTPDGTVTEWITRACVNDGRFRYEGVIHEQLVGPGSIGNAGLSVLHSGYSKEGLARKGKSERNLRLLQAELAKRPGDAYLRYQLGKTWLVAGNVAQALIAFEAALADAPAPAPYVSTLVCDYGYALKAASRPADAVALVRRYQARYPDYTDLWFLEGVSHLAAGNVREMLAAFERCLTLGEATGYSTMRGVGTFRARYNLGLYHELSGNADKARALYEQALVESPSFAPAAGRLKAMRG